ncbi:hypothetical protein DL93DRAFT_2075725 [Clavulina sp. PMI_390]|nr:hypothetical protein DL93DRAFT_2075725 [Clavulina sp. PMI_390]
MQSSARLADVRVQGAQATRTSFLDFLIRPHISSNATPSAIDGTMEDVMRRVSRITGHLEQTDIFASVQPALERSRSPLAEDGDLDLVLRVKERSRLFLKGATETGNGEGTASATAKIRNAFGGAETLEGTMSFGTTTRRSFQVRLEAPLTPSLRTTGEISAFQFDRDQTVFASSTESVVGARASVKTSSALGAHELAYEAALRRIKDLSPLVSPSLREAAGQSIKSSVSHTLIRDSRDLHTMGSTGAYFKLAQEIAGLGGDAHHFKTETDFSISRLVHPGMTLSLTARAGSLIPLFGKQTLFNDRFQLGGPTSLRMFRHNGLGPKDGGTSFQLPGPGWCHILG